MNKPILKPAKRVKRNRGSAEYKRRKQAYLASQEQWGGWYVCAVCRRVMTRKDIELDHIDNTGMGGSPARLMDEKNWQLLCRSCHLKKTDNIALDNIKLSN